MAIEPAAISARPAVTTIAVEATAPVNPAASAKGTVSPSDIPMTTSRTAAVAVKCFSMCSTVGILASLARRRYFQRACRDRRRGAYNYRATTAIQEVENDHHFWTRSRSPDELHTSPFAVSV